VIYLADLQVKMTTVQNQIKADMKIVANSIDAELNARDSNMHFRVAPDFYLDRVLLPKWLVSTR